MAEEQEIDFSKLSVDARVNHKNWKARVSGYEDLVGVFQRADEDKSPPFTQYAPSMKKIVVDSNAAAQEKGLAALVAFLEYGSPSITGKTCSDVVAGLIAKALNSSKAKTKELCVEIVLTYIEIERHEAVVEALIAGLDNKTPKIVAAVVTLIRTSLNSFGSKVIAAKPLVKVLPRLLEDRDKNIREEAKQLAVELYRWIRDALKPQLTNLKPVQISELEVEFNKIPAGEKPSPTRLLRSQQNRVAVADDGDGLANDDAADGGVLTTASDEVDPYDLMDPVDILSKLPKNFYELCEATKWSERKEALETLEKLTSSPKIQSGDYADLVRLLRKFISKDSNVVCAALGAKCLAGLAAGLRKGFHTYANSTIPILLEKFKEKKQNMVIALREAVDAVIVATTLEAVLEDVTGALDNKNPQIKSETALWLARTISADGSIVATNKKLLKALIVALTKTLTDMDAGVRDSAAEALGVIQKAVGEKVMLPLLGDMDPLKVAKVKECADKATVKMSMPPPPAVKSKSGPLPVRRPATTAAAAPTRAKNPPSATGSSDSLTSEGASSTKGRANSVDQKASVVRGATGSRSVKSNLPSSSIGAKSNFRSNPSLETLDQVDEQENEPPSGPRVARVVRSKTINKGKRASIPTGSVSAPQIVASSQPAPQSNGTKSSGIMPDNHALKDQRFADEKAFKVLKWNFTTPREEFFAQLKEQMMDAHWADSLVTQAFHVDFKFHLKVLESISEFLNAGNTTAVIANSDLIFKWIALRFFDTNPAVITRSLDLLIAILSAAQSISYTLHDYEVNALAPYLMIKLGDPKDVVKNKCHEILLLLAEVWSPSKLAAALLTGLASKNSRQRANCLTELGGLVESWGVQKIFAPSPAEAVRAIAKQIADRDNSVRTASLNTLVLVHAQEGPRMFKYAGQLSDKDLSLLEERIKRAAKNPPPSQPSRLPPPTALATAPPTGSSNGTVRRPAGSGIPAPGMKRIVPPSAGSAASQVPQPSAIATPARSTEQRAALLANKSTTGNRTQSASKLRSMLDETIHTIPQIDPMDVEDMEVDDEEEAVAMTGNPARISPPKAGSSPNDYRTFTRAQRKSFTISSSRGLMPSTEEGEEGQENGVENGSPLHARNGIGNGGDMVESTSSDMFVSASADFNVDDLLNLPSVTLPPRKSLATPPKLMNGTSSGSGAAGVPSLPSPIDAEKVAQWSVEVGHAAGLRNWRVQTAADLNAAHTLQGTPFEFDPNDAAGNVHKTNLIVADSKRLVEEFRQKVAQIRGKVDSIECPERTK